jgi:hypothetical protein
MVLRKSAAKRISEKNWYEIDHVEGIIAAVHRNSDPLPTWPVPVGENIFRDVTATSLDAAMEAASLPSNLRVLCRDCNGGKRASNSESRYMDQTGPQWVGLPYRGGRRSASPDMRPSQPPYGGGPPRPPGPSYSGYDAGPSRPPGPSYSGYGAGPSGPSYGGSDPGYDVVTADPRLRR